MPAKNKRDSSKKVMSPMPGVVKYVTHKVGDCVAQGEELCIIGRYWYSYSRAL